jgi:Asp/Glu/hydantoin racemase
MLGLLMLDTRFPRPPGDIGHPATFGFPVRRRVVEGAAPGRVVRGVAEDRELLARFVAAGHALVAEGAAAISTSCGFLARWQREFQAALPVPVWTSALLELQELAPRRCGVITIEASSLTAAHFLAVGADPATPVEGITPGSPLHRTLLEDRPELDEADARAQVLAAGRRLLAREPGLQALVLECTNLPPYAQALREATGLPVHDVVTMLRARMTARALSAPLAGSPVRRSRGEKP